MDTGDVIPPYGPGYDPPGPQLEGWQVARVAANAGFNDALVPGYSVSNLVVAVAIAKRESDWRTDATNPSGAKGLWQFLGHADIPPSCAYDAWCSAQKAWAYSSNGTNFFGPWVLDRDQTGFPLPPAPEFIVAAIAAVKDMRDRTERRPQPKEELMSLTVIDFKHPSTPPGRYRFVQLAPDDAHHQFRLVVRNGAKISDHPVGALGVAVTQASSGKLLGVEPEPDGVHFIVTADDGGTFRYAFQA